MQANIPITDTYHRVTWGYQDGILDHMIPCVRHFLISRFDRHPCIIARRHPEIISEISKIFYTSIDILTGVSKYRDGGLFSHRIGGNHYAFIGFKEDRTICGLKDIKATWKRYGNEIEITWNCRNNKRYDFCVIHDDGTRYKGISNGGSSVSGYWIAGGRPNWNI